MRRLGDKTIIDAALNVYYQYYKGFVDDDTAHKEGTLKRIKELRKKPVVANSLAVTIKLDAPDDPIRSMIIDDMKK